MSEHVANALTYRVSILKPIGYGRAKVVRSWITDADGAAAALETAGEFPVQIELERWEEGGQLPAWFSGHLASPASASSLQ